MGVALTPVKTSRSTPRLSKVARHVCVPKGIMSTGWGAVEAKMAKLGISFDEWQRGLGSLALAKREDGSYAASVGGVVVSIPRQTGKTYTIGWLIFGLCLLFPNTLVIWTAHRTRTSAETFASMRAMSEKPKVAPFIRTSRQANGQEAVMFRNGSRILFGARESGFGRGFAKVDVLVLDEAQILTENAMSDMVPATNAAPNGLVFLMGTPPRPKDPGEVFSSRRKDALQGDADTLYVEFSADPGTEPSSWKKGRLDWKQIRRANPSYPHRTNKNAIMRMRKLLGSDENFKREALGMWDLEAESLAAIPFEAWKKARKTKIKSGQTQSFAVRFSVDGSHVALAAASKIDDEAVLVDGVRVASASDGVDWLVDFLADPERLARTQQIVIEGKGGAAYLVDRLRAAKVPAKVLITPTVEQVIGAHSMFLEAVKAGGIVHRGTDELDREVSWAAFRKIGNAGGFGWQAPEGQTVALLDAATYAHWAAKTSKRKPKAARSRKVVVL